MTANEVSPSSLRTLLRAELAWHLEQLLHAPLTEREREEHRDWISWLEQQLARAAEEARHAQEAA